MIKPSDLQAAIAEAIKPLTEAASHIEHSLNTLATVELARTFYDRSEIQELMKRHQQLAVADNDAFKVMSQAHKDLDANHGSIGWEERVKKYGLDEATSMLEPSNQARLARVACMEALDAFEKEHPIIVALIKSRMKR